MAFRPARAKTTFNEINITPLTDVFLVLLVVIILAAPALSNIKRGIATPKVNQATSLSKDWLVVEVDKEGAIFVDGSQVAQPDVHQMLANRLPGLKEKKLVIRGDEISKSGVVLDILRTAQEVGFEQGFIAGQVQRITTKTE